MADDDVTLTPTQVYALVVLMAEARVVDNKELQELARFSLTGKDRTKLNDLGLVESSKVKQTYAHQLSDKGWRFMRERLLDSEPHRAGGSALRSMYTLLANLHRSLDRLQVPYGEFFKQTAPEPVPAGSDEEVEGRIRSTYAALATAPGEWVGLADLRDQLAGLDRSTVDTVLRSMARQDGVRIIPVANTKSLTERDRAAALRIGAEDNHTLAIGPA
jgi:hypothetical protein